MKIETYLNAMVKAELDRTDMRKRQIAAFRARILRMNAEKDDEIGEISHYFDYIFEQLEDCRKEIIEKDEEIRVLEKYIKDHDYKTILDYMEKYLEGDME